MGRAGPAQIGLGPEKFGPNPSLLVAIDVCRQVLIASLSMNASFVVVLVVFNLSKLLVLLLVNQLHLQNQSCEEPNQTIAQRK